VTPPASARAVILDRDGTIIVDRGYLDDPAALALLPGAAAGLRALGARGHPLIIVSNQSGVGRGRLTLARMHEVNAALLAVLEAEGVHLAGVYCCTHRPEDDCACRKPRTRLVLEAAAAHGFDPAAAVVIGDKGCDIELGRRLGATTLLISADGRTSDGTPATPDHVVPDLLSAARLIGAAHAAHPAA